ncbi:pantetheine-phosphate adenylyltransferase [Mycoplasmopsis verecunda]|uniref:Pantetheine-phosphate adenylyltransferase n=1 Tax=Mycoplasmopsis verecunda TaxID=171291 RepID=A0A1T4KVG0_9BACT|nr:pantetheine-phosphate adenylyltransferase [Mycoplasmopsis verecunda]WPB54628.1 pantetheine-phosphate adenylyltransferase [Mycoplasmopsis verecunda]SJZ46348.1 Phosphopantetheine adenylyltransferase [Mycoplasmopsis verecunda]
MQNKKIALYAGSFDPFHKGHEVIVQKALKLFDELYIVVTWNPDKDNKQQIENNYLALQEFYKDNNVIKVLKNNNKMTADLCKDLNIKWLVRSARNNNDYNYELELACGNKSLNHELETVLILPNCEDINYESRLIRHKEKINNV